jgi:regulator of nucleoside diphosphate kinase
MSLARTITITEQDSRRLAGVISLYENVEVAATLSLQNDLERAVVVPVANVSPSIVTMNSRVVVLDENEEPRELEVVYPWHADAARGRVSVLAPVGRAILGAAVGERVEIFRGGRVRVWSIQKILYQPEAAGDFHR